MSDHVLSAVFGEHIQMIPYRFNLLGGVLDSLRLGWDLLLRVHNACEFQALSFGLLIPEQSSVDKNHKRGGSGRCDGGLSH